MSESKHTKGEWRVMGSADPHFRAIAIKDFADEQLNAPVIGIFDSENRTIAYIGTTNDTIAEDEANAHLIAAAPKLLEAAMRVRARCQAMRLDKDAANALDDLSSAISLATGKDQ